MRGNAKVTHIPTKTLRKERLPQTIKGKPEEIHSISPNDRKKFVINYLKNSPPASPILQFSSITPSRLSVSPFTEHNIKNLEKENKQKKQCRLKIRPCTSFVHKKRNNDVSPNLNIDQSEENTKKFKESELKSLYSMDYLSNLRTLLNNLKVPMFKDRSCFLMSKEEYQNKLPKMKFLRVLKRIRDKKIAI